MSRPRLTVRRLMIAVAVLALLLGGYVKVVEYRRLALIYRGKAQDHAGMESTLRMIAARQGDASPVDISLKPGTPSIRFPVRAVAEFEAKLKRKYERAAARPWLPVAPDPMLPE